MKGNSLCVSSRANNTAKQQMQETLPTKSILQESYSDTLSPEDSEKVEVLYQRIQGYLKQGQLAIFGMGQELLNAKKLLGKGKFHQWITEKFPFSIRSAQRYMKVAKNLKPPTRHDVVLTDKTWYELSSDNTPDEIVVKVYDCIESGVSVTEEEIKRWIAELSPQNNDQSNDKDIEISEVNPEERISDTSLPLDFKAPETPDTKDSIIEKHEQLYQSALGSAMSPENVLSSEFSSKLREFLEFTLNHADLLDRDDSKQKLNHCMDEFNRSVNEINLRLGDFNEILDEVEEYETTSKDEISELVA